MNLYFSAFISPKKEEKFPVGTAYDRVRNLFAFAIYLFGLCNLLSIQRNKSQVMFHSFNPLFSRCFCCPPFLPRIAVPDHSPWPGYGTHVNSRRLDMAVFTTAARLWTAQEDRQEPPAAGKVVGQAHRIIGDLVSVAVQAVNLYRVERPQITLPHPGEGEPVKPGVVGDEADHALARFLGDAPFHHAEKADIEIGQPLPVGPPHPLGRAVGFLKLPLLVHHHARETLVRRITEDHELRLP